MKKIKVTTSAGESITVNTHHILFYKDKFIMLTNGGTLNIEQTETEIDNLVND